MSNRLNSTPNDLRAFWMPFTPMRAFRQAPLLFERAEGMHYITPDGRRVLDGMAGLWCVNAGHARPKIVEAIARQAGELDYAPAFQMGHPKAFELANRLVDLAPDGLDHVLFTNSGSESVETALEGLRLQYPGYAEKLERRFIRRTALRLEEREYMMMREDGLIGAEVHTALMQELAARRAAAEEDLTKMESELRDALASATARRQAAPSERTGKP